MFIHEGRDFVLFLSLPSVPQKVPGMWYVGAQYCGMNKQNDCDLNCVLLFLVPVFLLLYFVRTLEDKWVFLVIPEGEEKTSKLLYEWSPHKAVVSKNFL